MFGFALSCGVVSVPGLDEGRELLLQEPCQRNQAEAVELTRALLEAGKLALHKGIARALVGPANMAVHKGNSFVRPPRWQCNQTVHKGITRDFLAHKGITATPFGLRFSRAVTKTSI